MVWRGFFEIVAWKMLEEGSAMEVFGSGTSRDGLGKCVSLFRRTLTHVSYVPVHGRNEP